MRFKHSHFLFICFIFLVASCQPRKSAVVQQFFSCQEDCLATAMLVKDEFLKDPVSVLFTFQQGNPADTIEFDRWFAILRDEYFLNEALTETTFEERDDIRQLMTASTLPLINDKKVGAGAKRLIQALENLNFRSNDPGMYAPTVAVTGTYAFTLEDDKGSGELQIKQLDREAIRYSLLVVGGPPAYNQGMMEGEAWFGPGNSALLLPEGSGNTCQIQLTFLGSSIQAKTLQGDPAACGFGNGVTADGTYIRNSEEDPFQTAASNLAEMIKGSWVSASDPKSELFIDDEHYQEHYDGAQVGAFTYQYFENCPDQCNNIKGMSCLLVKGNYEGMCYTLVSVSDTRLEISMVGGTGNTLVYNRK